jgi:cytidylate kinase
MLNNSKEPDTPFNQSMFYELTPERVDSRLFIGRVVDPTADTIRALLKKANELGYEGIVLREVARNNWIKVVPEKFADIRIDDINKGNGKYENVAGSIKTKMGNVASFLLQPDMSDMEFRKERAVQRDHLNPSKAVDEIIKKDKRRGNYYNYHSGEKWGKATNYHLSVNSGFIGIDNTVECIKAFIDSIPE